MADAPADRSATFPEFVREYARARRADDKPPATLADWDMQRQQLRRKLIAAWGGFPLEKCPLEPKVLGELKRDGYRVEKVVFQTRPGVFMTANAYIPDGKGPFPAILQVHGHWKGAKQDPVVQSRCIGAVKHGFFVLCVDAFGAGERGLSKNLGEYHGEMVGATLFPVGLALSGLQVYENMRAIDYIQSRSEVDGTKIGVTGASGGGNQTMYIGAMDERLSAVVPVCSVGNYQVYLKAACCMCEVVPGALGFTEEAGVLSLVAPRGLMIVSATKDGIQFSVAEAQKSIAATKPVFELYGKADNLRHAIFESPHDYNKDMREAMYGWMTLHLKGKGDGSPLPDPKIETEKPEDLRCYPGESRPEDYVTVPKFAAAAGRAILAGRTAPEYGEKWEAESLGMRHALERDVLGGIPKRGDVKASLSAAAESKNADGRTAATLSFQPEAGVPAIAALDLQAKSPGVAIVLDLDKGAAAIEEPVAKELRAKGWSVVAAELRGTATSAMKGDGYSRAPDHNSAEWSMWVGRPLLGQWTVDVIRLLDALAETKSTEGKPVTVVGIGPAGIVALCAAALDKRISQAVCVKTLATYVTESPYVGQRMGILAPHIVKKVGDVGHLAALVAPRKVVFAGGVNGDGTPSEKVTPSFAVAEAVFKLQKAPRGLTLTNETAPAKLIEML